MSTRLWRPGVDISIEGHHIRLPQDQACFYYPHMPIGKLWIYRLLFVCFLFVRLRISPPTSKFARRFIGVQGRESPIFVNFAPPEAQNRTNRRVREDDDWLFQPMPPRRSWNIARSVHVGSASADRGPSPLTYLSFLLYDQLLKFKNEKWILNNYLSNVNGLSRLDANLF